jgi:hypothetical protein
VQSGGREESILSSPYQLDVVVYGADYVPQSVGPSNCPTTSRRSDAAGDERLSLRTPSPFKPSRSTPKDSIPGSPRLAVSVVSFSHSAATYPLPHLAEGDCITAAALTRSQTALLVRRTKTAVSRYLRSTRRLPHKQSYTPSRVSSRGEVSAGKVAEPLGGSDQLHDGVHHREGCKVLSLGRGCGGTHEAAAPLRRGSCRGRRVGDWCSTTSTSRTASCRVVLFLSRCVGGHLAPLRFSPPTDVGRPP